MPRDGSASRAGSKEPQPTSRNGIGTPERSNPSTTSIMVPGRGLHQGSGRNCPLDDSSAKASAGLVPAGQAPAGSLAVCETRKSASPPVCAL